MLATAIMSCYIASSQTSPMPEYLIIGVCWVSRKVDCLVEGYKESYLA